MKYATLLLGLTILIASVAIATACDGYIFVCKPGLTRVDVLLSDGSEVCNKAQRDGMFAIGGKSYPPSSPLFRFRQTERGGTIEQTLDYRGERCVGPFTE
jgi:hypothetical protein